MFFLLIVLRISIVTSFLLNLELNNTSKVRNLLTPKDEFSSYFASKADNLLIYDESLPNNWKSLKSCITMNYEYDNRTDNNFISFSTIYLSKMCFSDCSTFNKYAVFDSIAMHSICPLKGTVDRATLYKPKEIISTKTYELVIFMEGCFWTSPNGTKEEVTWIVNSNWIINKNEFLSFKSKLKAIETTTKITFNNLNSDCDNLCAKHKPKCSVSEKKFEENTQNLQSEININGLIYFISILCATALCYIIFNYLKSNFCKRENMVSVVTTID